MRARIVAWGATLVVLASLLVAPPPAAHAATATDTLLLLMDLSGSMSDKDRGGRIKVEGAKTGVIHLLDALPGQARVGLMTYPGNGGCTAPTTVRGMTALSEGNLGAQVSALPTPNGGTPTAEALRAAAESVRQDGGRATIVLVSDGLANCGEPPCPVAREIAASGIPITVNTIGFDIENDGSQELDCIAKATGGRHVNVDEGAGLGEEIRRQITPILEISANYPAGTIPVSSPGALVQARITNSSGVTATNVRVALTPTGTGTYLPIHRPVIALGNLAGGESREVSWTIPVTPELSGKSAQLRITASGANAPLVQSEGVVRFGEGALVSADSQFAGAQRVAVLGDSFSSGDGAYKKLDEYADTRCRTTDKTYADVLFPGKVDNFACTGAEMPHFASESQYAGMKTQIEQLREELGKGSRYDLLFLTIGGNDVGFETIVKNCITHQVLNPLSRGAGLILNPCLIDPDSFLYKHQMKFTEGKSSHLQFAYQDISAAFSDRGHSVPPIIVSPYPLMFPTDPGLRSFCGLIEMGVSRERFQQFLDFQRTLNRVTEEAVNRTRAENGIPVYFADTAAYTFQTDHTMCSSDSWVAMPRVGNATPLVAWEWDTPFHPTIEGHAAWGLSLARWAEKPGLELERGTKPRGQRVAPHTFRLAPRGSIDASASRNTVATGPADLTVTGVAPGSPIITTVESHPYSLAYAIADENGNAVLSVDLARSGVPPGLHTLKIGLIEPDGRQVIRESPLYVTRPIPYVWWVLLGLGVAATITGVILWWRMRRSG